MRTFSRVTEPQDIIKAGHDASASHGCTDGGTAKLMGGCSSATGSATGVAARCVSDIVKQCNTGVELCKNYSIVMQQWLHAIFPHMRDGLQRMQQLDQVAATRVTIPAPVITQGTRDDVLLQVAHYVMDYMYKVQQDVETRTRGWHIVCKLRKGGKGRERGDLYVHGPDGAILRSFSALEAYLKKRYSTNRRRRRAEPTCAGPASAHLRAGYAPEVDEASRRRWCRAVRRLLLVLRWARDNTRGNEEQTDEGISAYERQRLDNMARNREMLMAMGLETKQQPTARAQRARASYAQKLAKRELTGRCSHRLRELREKSAAATATRHVLKSTSRASAAPSVNCTAGERSSVAPAVEASSVAAAEGGACGAGSTLTPSLSPAPPSSSPQSSLPRVEAMLLDVLTEEEVLLPRVEAILLDVDTEEEARQSLAQDMMAWEGGAMPTEDGINLEELWAMVDELSGSESGEHPAVVPTADASVARTLEAKVERSSRAKSGFTGVKITPSGMFQPQLAAAALTGVPQLGLGSYKTAFEAAEVLAKAKQDLRNGKMLNVRGMHRTMQRAPIESTRQTEKGSGGPETPSQIKKGPKAHRHRTVAQDCSEVAANTQKPEDIRPLTPANAVGRRVLVPRSLWPTYPCNEHGGKGWEAKVLRVWRGWATLAFVYDVDCDGRPAANEELQLKHLKPLVQEVEGVPRAPDGVFQLQFRGQDGGHGVLDGVRRDESVASIIQRIAAKSDVPLRVARSWRLIHEGKQLDDDSPCNLRKNVLVQVIRVGRM